jgi:uncharacterized integral membrane protein
MEYIGLLILLAFAAGALINALQQLRHQRRLSRELEELHRRQRYEYLKRLYEQAP